MSQQERKQGDVDPFWVGVGASAGGLDALKELLSEIEHAEEAIFVIAQHLDPKHPTILQDLLARITNIPVVLVEQDVTPVPGSIYLISPGHNATIVDRRITLTPAAPVGPKPSINELFSSLADDVADKTIGVILSGTGSDGAQGMIAIKAAGGITLAQDEQTAKYSGMPRAARETGFVDLVLPPRDIAREIRQFIVASERRGESLSTPKMRSNLEKIFQRIFDQTGYDFSGYKLKTVQRRIQRRMAVHKLVTMDDYVTLLMGSADEVEALFKDMLISVTAFFRDPEPFSDLGNLIDQMVEKAEDYASIRVWVPGCANGEEAYSICILFQQAAIRHRKELALQIFATDIDDHALDRARRGVYSSNQVKDVEPEILQSYFRERDGHFHISKRIRDQVVFARQNLVMDPPFSHLDLISCRNVLIYFNLETQRTILQVFHFALKRRGYLFLGKSESASNTTPELFESLYKTSQIFVRRSTAVSERADQLASAGRMGKLRSSRQAERTEPPGGEAPVEADSIERMLERVLLDSVVPVAIALDSQGNIHHIRGDVSRFLSFPQGRIDTTIFSLARDDLRLDIRSLLQRAKREGRASSQALFYRHEDKNRSLFLRLCRLDLPEHGDLYLLVFIDLDLEEGARLLDVSAKDPASLSYQQLEQELVLFRKRLQSSVEDLETTNEELQSTNEELQSANEELQSSNEELQTANEELQSTNEELSTVNQELEVKTFELEQVNNDLESMLLSIDQIILFIDNRLRLQRYTRKAADTFGLDADDLRQPVTSMGYVVDVPHLRLELLNVIELEKESTLRANLAAGYFNLRLVPYKAEKEAVVGVIMFFEPDEQRSQQYLSRMARGHLELLSRLTDHAVIAINPHGKIVHADERVAALFEYAPDALVGQNIKMLMPEPYRGHHDAYLREYEQGQSKGVVGRWRSVTGLDRHGNRFIAQLRIEEIGDEDNRLYVGLFAAPENTER